MLCKGCGLERDLSCFYASNKATCKDCVKSRARKNRVDNIDRVTAYEKSRAQDPKRMEARRQYQKTEAGIAASTKAKLKYKEKNPKKRSIHIVTGNAIRDGLLFKKPCEVCNTRENIVAHHCDYDKPLEIMWLCSQHHHDWHSVNGEGLNGE